MARIFYEQDKILSTDGRINSSTVPLSSAFDDDYYEVNRTATCILKNGFRRVALQFPDEMLPAAAAVVSRLQQLLSLSLSATQQQQQQQQQPLAQAAAAGVMAGSEQGAQPSSPAAAAAAGPALVAAPPCSLFVLADTSYGACCVDEVAAAHVDADLVVHYGPACLSATSRLPVLYVFGRAAVDVAECAAAVAACCAPDEPLLVFADVRYQHAMRELESALRTRGYGPSLVFSRISDRLRWPPSAAATAVAAPPAVAVAAASSACSCGPAAAAAAAAGGAACDSAAAAAGGCRRPGSPRSSSNGDLLAARRLPQSAAGAAADTATHTPPSPAAGATLLRPEEEEEEARPAAAAAAAEIDSSRSRATIHHGAQHDSSSSNSDDDDDEDGARGGDGGGAAGVAGGGGGNDQERHVFCGRRFRLPAGTQLGQGGGQPTDKKKKVLLEKVFFVGPEGPTLTNLMMSFNRCSFYSFDPERRRQPPGDSGEGPPVAAGASLSRLESAAVNRALRRRYYLVQQAKDADVFGIVVGTLAVARYREVIERVQSMVRRAGKRSYLLLVGKLNVAKLANFQEIEAFVLVACPENSLLDSRDFLRPIVTPFELQLALVPGHEWSGEYSTAFSTLLPPPPPVPAAGSSATSSAPPLSSADSLVAAAAAAAAGSGHSEEHAGQQQANDYDGEEEETRFSFISGSLKKNHKKSALAAEVVAAASSGVGSGSELALRDTPSDIVAWSAASSHLQSRSFKGLEPLIGQTPVASAVQGRLGLAKGYAGEQQHSPP